MIRSSLRGMKPFGRIPAWHDILLDAECRQKKTVDHIFRSEQQLDRLPDRNVQFVDLTIAFRMLHFPHPLFSHDMQFHGIRRHPRHAVVNTRSPNEDSHHDCQWDEGPRDFDLQRRRLPQRAIDRLALPIFEQKIDHRPEDDQHQNRTQQSQRPKQIIHLRCGCGRLGRKEGNLHAGLLPLRCAVK